MKVVIVLGGDAPASVLMNWRFKAADFSIAADGGMHACVAAGLEPDLLIGDMDSFVAKEGAPACDTIRIDGQEQTDFQKALSRPEPQGADEVVVLGGTGGRNDHFLNNLLIAASLPLHASVIFDSDNEIIHRVTSACPFACQGMDGQTVSLIPLGDCGGVCSKGFEWPLVDESMGVGKQLCQSNVARADEIAVSLESGILFLVVLKH
ncbi:MAG: thiamine diphosphokinase [Opitutae bacterium]|nr:thiamine diphosphokinase [Opitutae bacterium]